MSGRRAALALISSALIGACASTATRSSTTDSSATSSPATGGSAASRSARPTPPPEAAPTAAGAEPAAASVVCESEVWVPPDPDAPPPFDIDSLDLRPSFEPTLAALRDRLRAQPGVILAVEWYGADTSERGLDLTRRRAARLRERLLRDAPERARVEASGCYASERGTRPSLRIVSVCPGAEHTWCTALPEHVSPMGQAGVWRVQPSP